MPNNSAGDIQLTSVPSGRSAKPGVNVLVSTYHAEHGHADPVVPIEVSGGQGLTIKLPALENGVQPDIYIERRENGSWRINIGDDSDIAASFDLTADGLLTAGDRHARVMFSEQLE